MITENEILETHKKSHGVYPGHKDWDNPKWLDKDEWGIDYGPWHKLLNKAHIEGYKEGEFWFK